MKKLSGSILLFSLGLFLVGCYVVAPVPPGQAKKGVIVAPVPAPVIVLQAKPRLVLIQDWGVYYAPDIDDEVYFFDGVWFVFSGGHWYESRSHSGPWVVVADGNVPGKLKGAKGWRAKPIPPGQMKKGRHR
jgi:hypothetical protein